MERYYHGLDLFGSKQYPTNDFVYAKDSSPTWYSSPTATKEFYGEIVGLVCAAIIMTVFIAYFLYCLCFRKREGVVYESMRQPHLIVNVVPESCPAC